MQTCRGGEREKERDPLSSSPPKTVEAAPASKAGHRPMRGLAGGKLQCSGKGTPPNQPRPPRTPLPVLGPDSPEETLTAALQVAPAQPSARPPRPPPGPARPGSPPQPNPAGPSLRGSVKGCMGCGEGRGWLLRAPNSSGPWNRQTRRNPRGGQSAPQNENPGAPTSQQTLSYKSWGAGEKKRERGEGERERKRAHPTPGSPSPPPRWEPGGHPYLPAAP